MVLWLTQLHSLDLPQILLTSSRSVPFVPDWVVDIVRPQHSQRPTIPLPVLHLMACPLQILQIQVQY